MRHFPASQLIINSDGSIFHLHVQPSQLADKIILVGDPERVNLIAEYFDQIECKISNREFVTVTGTYKGKRLTVISTGIGTDNIDIVLNEIDALANIDFVSRTEKMIKKQLTFVRIGTTGGMQADIPLGSYLISEKSIGFDEVLAFYDGRDTVSDLEFEEAFVNHMNWPKKMAVPYIVSSDAELIDRIGGREMIKGVTISSVGFYGPQGRVLRLNIFDPQLNEKVESFEFKGQKITNYEMEGSAIAGLSALMGHKAMTVCCVIANRRIESMNTDYKPQIRNLVELVLERI